MEIGQDTISSFASSLHGGFQPHNKENCRNNVSPEARCEYQGENCLQLGNIFSYLPRSLTSTAASENGARQCARDYWECSHFREATQSQILMEEERCPPCKYSLKRTSTNLIQFRGRTVLLGETCSQRALLLSVPQLSERKHLVECYQAWNIPKEEEPASTEIAPPTDANLALHVQRAHLQMLSWKVADKSDHPDVQLTGYGWEVKEHEHVMPVISREPAAPSKLVDVVSCSCKAEGKVCSGRYSYGSNGMSYTSYCVCEGGMLAVTHLINRRRTKATHNRVK